MSFDPTTETKPWHAAATKEKAEGIAKKNCWKKYEIFDIGAGTLRWIVVKNVGG